MATINSLAYDPYNQVVYYANGAGATTNKSIFKYDVKTCTRTTFIADVTASPFHMSLNSQGVGGGGAAFYNGSLFFGVDAGVSVTEDNTIWRIDMDAAGQATGAARVFSVQANEGSTSLYNWGDFVIHDGTLYNFNSATSPAAGTQLLHYNLNAQERTAGYTLASTGQAALGYDGTVYNVTDGLAVYAKTGTLGAAMAFGGDWPAGVAATDGGGAFRFPADFGDAPAGYGRPFHRFTPCASAPATLQLGATIDYEMAPAAGGLATGDNGGNYAGSGTTNDEDGVAAFPALTLTSAGTTTAYALTVAVRNTTGVARLLRGWLDFDGDGKFSAGEYANASVPPNATSALLTWAARAAGTTRAGLTYARFRLTTTTLADNAATAEDERALDPATDGEVEDYSLQITLSLSGTVLRDANGLMDNQVNGSALGLAGQRALYAYLVQGTTITDKASVNSNGQYTLANASANTAYTLVVSATSAAVGAPAPVPALPAGWVSVGETAGTTPDANPDGLLTLITTAASLGGLNFGLQQLPLSYGASYAILLPPVNTVLPLTAASDLEPLSGSDPEDGPLGANSQVIITSLAGMEGNELYYNGMLLQAGSSIRHYNPDLLALRMKSPGSNGATFDFAFVDAAGQRTAAPATYSITWAMPLPLTLISFEVRKANRQASLQWVTALEENTQSFVLEHSLDGENWTVIGSRPAAGTSTGKLSYSFIHASPAQGANLYRLKMVDLDGSFTYSAVKALTVSEAPGLRCYPNPVTDKLYLAAPAASGLERLTLTDSRGSLVYDGKPLPAGYIDMQHLPAGLYVVQVFGPHAPAKSYKVVKR